jgi:hypothetical protein
MTPKPVTAQDFAEDLYEYLARLYDLDRIGLTRIEFVRITMEIIYEAMIKTSAQGIRQ